MEKPIEKFATAEEAWFWFIRCERAREEGARRAPKGNAITVPPCEPADIIRTLQRMYDTDILLPTHAYILGFYGEQERPPDPNIHEEVLDWVLWIDAFDYIEAAFREKGFIE